MAGRLRLFESTILTLPPPSPGSGSREQPAGAMNAGGTIPLMSRNAAPARERCSAPHGAALTSSLSPCHRSLPCASLPARRCRSQQAMLSASSSQSDGGAASASGCASCASALPVDGKPCPQRCCLSLSRGCMGVCPRVPAGGCFGKGQKRPLLPWQGDRCLAMQALRNPPCCCQC